MFALICLAIMILITGWYLIAENQKNKTRVSELEDDLQKAIRRIASLEEKLEEK